MHDDYDRSSKWLLQHHGDSILRIAGIERVRAWRALPAQVVQPKQLPDALLEVEFFDKMEAELFLLEIATYPEERLQEQLLRGMWASLVVAACFGRTRTQVRILPSRLDR